MYVDEAISILGGDKVVTCKQALEAFEFDRKNLGDSYRSQVLVPYDNETLRDFAILNKYGYADWRLVFGLPLSFREQHDIIGTTPKSQPYFAIDNDWWLNECEGVWAESQPEAGYYLIDFLARFSRDTWEDQDIKIVEMGPNFERADERVFSQALISIFKTRGGERLHPETFHWGRIKTSDGGLVLVNGFNPECGLGIIRLPQFVSTCSAVVCVSRKSDF